MTTIDVSTTEAVFTGHLQALMSRDVEAIVRDYASDAVVLTPNGAFKGTEQISMFFTESMKMLTPDVLSTLKVIQQHIDGEFVYVLWSAGAVIPFAGDTFCIRGEKIVMQSFVPAP